MGVKGGAVKNRGSAVGVDDAAGVVALDVGEDSRHVSADIHGASILRRGYGDPALEWVRAEFGEDLAVLINGWPTVAYEVAVWAARKGCQPLSRFVAT